jgi:signal transduction histidine kinase
MPYALDETSTVSFFPKRYRPSRRAEVIGDSTERALGAPERLGSESQARNRQTQTEFAHANRLEMLGHLSASIAHEVKQPISAVIMNAQTALRLLETEPADMEAVRRLLGWIVRDGTRTGEIVERTRTLIKKAPPRREGLDINAAIIEAIEVTQQELVANGVSLQLKLAKDLPLIWADRVQLQQVMLNLIINAIQAMSACAAGASNLLIHSAAAAGPAGVLVTVEDSGPGIDPADIERIFEAFFSTKPSGLGMGLSICRAIVESHGGTLSASRRAPCGTTLRFVLPTGSGDAAPA